MLVLPDDELRELDNQALLKSLSLHFPEHTDLLFNDKSAPAEPTPLDSGYPSKIRAYLDSVLHELSEEQKKLGYLIAESGSSDKAMLKSMQAIISKKITRINCLPALNQNADAAQLFDSLFLIWATLFIASTAKQPINEKSILRGLGLKDPVRIKNAKKYLKILQ